MPPIIAARAFSPNAWKFSITGSDKTDVWDQFAKLGSFVKGDAATEFTAETLAQIVENFARRKNDIGMDFDHQALSVNENGQPAPALAWYDALAVVIGGEVLKFASHAEGVTPPNFAGRDDGLYGHRAEVTPLGHQLLPNYRYISPAFTPAGLDEQGEEIGYDLLNVAATNIPFLDGMEPITFHRGTFKLANQETAQQAAQPEPPPERSPALGATDEEDPLMEELLRRMGVAPDASDEEKQAALQKFADEHQALIGRCSELEQRLSALEEGRGDKEAMAETAEPGGGGGAQAGAGQLHVPRPVGEDEKFSAIASELGLAPNARPAEVLAALRATRVPHTEFAQIQKRVSQLETQRGQNQLEQWVDTAIGQGQWDPEKRAELLAFARANIEAAGRSLMPAGHYATSGVATQRFTTGGSPIGATVGERQQRVEMLRAQAGTAGVLGEQFALEAQRYAKENKVPIGEAQRAVAKLKPDLWRAYREEA